MSSLLKLECPLCCNETFNSHDSLKYHLLSIIDNLLCPSCGQRFEKIHDLADHLGIHLIYFNFYMYLALLLQNLLT